MQFGGHVRRFTPLILLGLTALAWFEPYIPGHESIVENLGAMAVLRFVTGLLCVFLVIQVLEQRRLELLFKQVVDQFRKFHAAQTGRGDPASGEDPEAREQAVRILISALESPDATVVANARDHLKRLTGQDLGAAVGPWTAWADAEFGKK